MSDFDDFMRQTIGAARQQASSTPVPDDEGVEEEKIPTKILISDEHGYAGIAMQAILEDVAEREGVAGDLEVVVEVYRLNYSKLSRHDFPEALRQELETFSISNARINDYVKNARTGEILEDYDLVLGTISSSIGRYVRQPADRLEAIADKAPKDISREESTGAVSQMYDLAHGVVNRLREEGKLENKVTAPPPYIGGSDRESGPDEILDPYILMRDGRIIPPASRRSGKFGRIGRALAGLAAATALAGGAYLGWHAWKGDQEPDPSQTPAAVEQTVPEQPHTPEQTYEERTKEEAGRLIEEMGRVTRPITKDAYLKAKKRREQQNPNQ